MPGLEIPYLISEIYLDYTAELKNPRCPALGLVKQFSHFGLEVNLSCRFVCMAGGGGGGGGGAVFP